MAAQLKTLDKDVAWPKKKKKAKDKHTQKNPPTKLRTKALTGNINSDTHRMWTIILWRAVAHTVLLTKGLSTTWLGRRASLRTGQPGYVQAW